MKNAIFALFLGLACVLACQSKQQKLNTDQPKSKTGSPEKQVTFFDSVDQKKYLDIPQIIAHTNIDSFYYTGLYTDAVFSGDTVISFYDGIRGAIVNYSDGRNCSYKFLLIFSPGSAVSLDYRKIATDCDRDLSSRYYYVTYKFATDSMLEPSEYSIAPNNEDDD